MYFYIVKITTNLGQWPAEGFKTRQAAIDRIGAVMAKLKPICIAAVITPVPMSEKETT